MRNKLAYTKITNKLNRQKERLGMSNAVLADRSEISIPTIQRILSGKTHSSNFDHVLAVADALGVDLFAKAENAEELKRQQAHKKALEIMGLVRGNSALEGQKISKKAHKEMIEKTINELLTGSKKNLWAA